MARPIWKGHISFGLIHIPVTLFPVENRSDMHFHMVDSRNHARVRYERINEVTGKEVPWASVVKGFEYDDGNMVLLKDEDFKRADVEATQAVEVEEFVDRRDLDWVYFDKPYILVPGKRAEKSYVLLRETLESTGKAGIARVVIRTREYVSALMPRGNALFLELLRYQPELRKLSEFDLPKGGLKEHGVSEKERELAKKLVESMDAPWKPDKYRDRYRDNLMKWIDQKARAGGKALPPLPEEKEEGEPVDIMDLLRRSMKAHHGDRKAAAAR